MSADRLLTSRELASWGGCFLMVATLLVWMGFTSSDPDSALYAGLAERLAQEPVSRWLAPEWWGFWPEAKMTGLFREHPAGVLLVPAALSRLGIPAAQGAYIVGVASALASLLLMGTLLRRFVSRDDARLALVLLQLMPVAFIFRIRANHEYPMLACLLVTLLGLVYAAERRRLWLSALLVGAGLAGGLVVKGVFVAKILLAMLVWIALNPLGGSRPRLRCSVSGVAGVLVMIAAAMLYERAYFAATQQPFWFLYWERQIGPLTETSAVDVALLSLRNLLFYVSRLVWHPAPWSLALIIAAWRLRGRFRATWDSMSETRRAGLTFALLFAGLAILLLAPASRYAERYAFSATHAIACAGVAVTATVWPRLAGGIRSLDRRIFAFPALLWLALALLRLTTGSVLPRL